jgi:protein-tyrosine phosphatase
VSAKAGLRLRQASSADARVRTPHNRAMRAAFSVTFVCMGNICRSPTAHGVFMRRLSDAGLTSQVRVDSAGTHDLHRGEGADRRSQRHALERGYDLSRLRARQLAAKDFGRSDLMLAMDWDNLRAAEERCPPEHRYKLRRLTEFCLRYSSEIVPDPYYGGVAAFEHVLDLIEDACDGLLEHVRREVASRSPIAGAKAQSPTPRGADK